MPKVKDRLSGSTAEVVDEKWVSEDDDLAVVLELFAPARRSPSQASNVPNWMANAAAYKFPHIEVVELDDQPVAPSPETEVL